MPGPFARLPRARRPSRGGRRPPARPRSDDLLAEWSEPRTLAADARRIAAIPVPRSAGKPLEGLRVVDFTWVLAGPFANRIMGDLGADVLKFQTAERATLVNSPDFPYFYVWNRSKRLALAGHEARPRRCPSSARSSSRATC